MFTVLLLLFIIVPLLEIWVIIQLGGLFGYPFTLLILLVISVLGAALAKKQGYAAVARIQDDVRFGKMPGDSLIDGVLILAAAILLITPGYITDTVGLLLLLPPVRRPARSYIKRRLQRSIAQRATRFMGPDQPYGPGGPGGPPPGQPPYEPEQRRKELEK